MNNNKQNHPVNNWRHSKITIGCILILFLVKASFADPPNRLRVYQNELSPIPNAKPLLADYPKFVEPIRTAKRFQAPPLVIDDDANLEVRAWRFSYNARAIIETPNQLNAKRTAIIVVHPWGIDDGQGWKSPTPAGTAFFCTPEKNAVYMTHLKKVLNPFLKRWRDKVGLVAYSLPGREDAIRRKLYRSIRRRPTENERATGAKEVTAKLNSFVYRGQPIPKQIKIGDEKQNVSYFRQFPGLDAGVKYNGAGFWSLPIPVAKPIEADPNDVVIYDAEGYGPLKSFLEKQGIRHVLLCGYATDMCVCSTTAGYKNLCKDFNVFVVGDATLATCPAHDTPRFATSAALAKASMEVFITQVSWIRNASQAAGPVGGKR